VVAVVVLLASAAGEARAADRGSKEEQERKAQARVRYNQGAKHYNLGEFADALREFKEAYRLVEDPIFLYNMGQCHWKLKDYESALHAYRGYLRQAGEPPKAAEVRARISDLEARIARNEPQHSTTPPPIADATDGPHPSVGPEAPPAALVEPAVAVQAAPTQSAPVYKRWWFWSAIGAAVLAGVAIGLAARDPGRQAPVQGNVPPGVITFP
jgi:tetratricopeptide (TPR) repeat protein